MSEQMSQAAASRVKSLCDQIAGTHGLDEEIHRELRGHMEDEFLAYIAGRQRLTDEDALILVEKHFGDPAVIRSLFRAVHCAESNVSLLHRLLGLAVVTSVGSLLSILIWAVVAAICGPAASSSRFLIGALAPFYLWGAGIWWSRRAQRGLTPWFDRISVRLLIGVIAALLVLVPTAQSIAFGVWPVTVRADWSGWLWITIGIAYSTVFSVASATAWAWWCDWPGLGTRRAILGASACAGYSILHAIGTPAAAYTLTMGNMELTRQLWVLAGVNSAHAVIVTMVGFGFYWMLIRRAKLAVTV